MKTIMKVMSFRKAQSSQWSKLTQPGLQEKQTKIVSEDYRVIKIVSQRKNNSYDLSECLKIFGQSPSQKPFKDRKLSSTSGLKITCWYRR